MKKGLLFVTLLAGLALTSLTGCQKNNRIVIGILQPAEHSALDEARKGFIEGLEKNSFGKDQVKIVYQNAMGVEADQITLANSLVANSDLLLGIGTGASLSLKNALDEAGKETPLLFTAVTDPVKAHLVTSLENHGGFVTGTSDDNPVEAQIDLVERCLKNEEKQNLKIGIIYTESEINSEVQADRAAAEAALKGMAVERATVNSSSDIQAVATNLCATKGIDALYVPTDNNIASNMDPVKIACENNHVLLVVGEENMVKAGGHVTLSIDYKLLGKRTGEMAASILKEEKTAGEIDVEKMLEDRYLNKVFSSKNINDAGITINDGALEGFTDLSK